MKQCVTCAGVEAFKPARNAPMHVYHPSRRFAQVAVDVQTFTPRTSKKFFTILVLVDTFNCFARAVAIPDKIVENIYGAIVEEWISIFGPIEFLLSD